MPYIQLELEAKRKIPACARAAGISCGDLAWGLLDAWEYCWEHKRAVVAGSMLLGFFGSSDQPRLVTALEGFGFIESQPEGFRIRGASRYLRIAQARAEGGRKAVGNLRQFSGSSRKGAGREPDTSTGSTPALTPNTEHRTPKEEVTTLRAEPAGAPKPKRRPGDPRLMPLRASLVQAYERTRGEKYCDRGAADTEAVKKLLPLGDDAFILGRAETLFGSADQWARADSIAHLPVAWGRTGPPNGSAERAPDVRKGSVRAEGQNHGPPGFHTEL